MNTLTVIFLTFVAWLIIGFIGSGFVYAFFQRKYPELANDCREDDTNHAIEMIPYGPFCILHVIAEGLWVYGWIIPGKETTTNA